MTAPKSPPPARDTLQTFSRFYLDLVATQVTGTLIVCTRDERRFNVLFDGGRVIDLDTGGEESLLLRAFLGVLSEREVRKAEKKATRSGQTPAQWLLERGLVEEVIILDRVAQAFTDSFCDLFGADLEFFEFYEHGAEERIEEFNSELSEVFDLFFDGEDLFVEAMRRLGQWALVEESLTSLHDVYYATPRSMKYYNNPAQYGLEVQVIGKIDGYHDLLEAIKSLPISSFVAHATLKQLARNGEIVPINPVQLFQLGMDTADRGNHGKARKAFRRAMDLGLDDFDIQYQLAESTAQLGNIAEAVALFKEFGEKCAGQFRHSGAVHAYTRIAELDPDEMGSQRRLLELCVNHERPDKAVTHALAVAERLRQESREREALDHLVYLRDFGVDDPQLKHRIVELARSCGDEELSHQDDTATLTAADGDEDPRTSLERYERLFADGDESLDVRVKLLTLHLKIGHNEQCLAHLNGILGTQLELDIENQEVLAWLHKIRASLAPGHAVSSRWLVDYQLQGGRTKEAIATLRRHIAELEKQASEFLVVEARKRLIVLDPDNYAPRWELAALFERSGQLDKAVHEINQVARLAVKHEDRKTTREAWTRVVQIAPFHREALAGLADCLESAGDAQGAAERYEAIARLDLVRGAVAAGRACLERLRTFGEPTTDLVHRLALASLECGDKEEGVRLLDSTIDLALVRRELTAARDAIDRAFRETPGRENVLAARSRLEALERGTGAGAGAAPAAAAPPTAAAPSAPLAEAPPHAPAAAAAAAAAPAPAAAPQVDASEAAEPFQGRRPVTRGKVSAITARLKSLKEGDRKPAGGGKVLVGGLKKISANLKRMQEAPAAQPGVPASAGLEATPTHVATPAPAASAGSASALKGAASRLKALAANQGAASEPAAGTEAAGCAQVDALRQATEALAKDDGGIQIKKSMGSAASRLARLKAARQASDPAGEDASATAPSADEVTEDQGEPSLER